MTRIVSTHRLFYIGVVTRICVTDKTRLHTWRMSFNINKCHTLHAHRKKQLIIHTYTMDNTPVTPVTHHPYLGIELQSDFRWTTYIQNTTNKTQKTLNMLKRNLKQASTTVKSQAYRTKVRPQLEYASAIWDPHTAKDTDNLNKIQNYAKLLTLHNRLFLTKTTELAFSFGPTSTK